MEGYDREMTEIQFLKNLIEKSTKRVEQLVKKTKEDILTAEKINETPAEDIIKEIFKEELENASKEKE